MALAAPVFFALKSAQADFQGLGLDGPDLGLVHRQETFAGAQALEGLLPSQFLVLRLRQDEIDGICRLDEGTDTEDVLNELFAGEVG